MSELPIVINHTLDLESCKGCDQYELDVDHETFFGADGEYHVIGIINCEYKSVCHRNERRSCTMREESWDDGQCVWGCICSACGEKFTYEHGRTWNFCPKCGARVVDE